ncbi:MAG: 3-isopropylmalate dehydratase small subunit [Alphaproteobacteria bacterium]|nr:3-isopropylmalate dehydratase small subunit [Alphaproteobacteria bacterium]
MQKFTTLTAQAAYMPIANIDTDMIIPKQYLKTITRSGLGKWLFAAMRYDAHGKEIPDFILNANPQAQILLAGENFGCGSSREHAPWALTDFGIRAVIAPGFADIFYNNCFKNGLLPVRLPKEAIAELAESKQDIQINLKEQAVICGNRRFDFDIEPNNKAALLNGLDAIEPVLAMRSEIKKFEAAHFARQPWLKVGG